MSSGNSTISTEEPRITNLRIQTSAYGMVIPLVWGKTRITGNLMWYGDFTAIEHRSSQSAGGKGGGGITSVNINYSYTAAMAIGLGHGVISEVRTVWADKKKTTLSAVGFTLFDGSFTQSPWSYLTSRHPTEAIGYRGTAYIAGATIDLGTSATIPQLSMEVVARGSTPLYGDDALPGTVLTDIVTDPLAGLGLDAGILYSLSDYNAYCVANNFFISPAWKEQVPAYQCVQDVLDATNSDVVWSGSQLKIKPYGDAAITGALGSWTPNLTPEYDLTDDDFLHEEGDETAPVVCYRGTPADAYNQLQVEYVDRNADYNTAIVEAKDQANIELYGLRADSPASMHMICRSQMAQDIADLRLRRKLYVRNIYEFKLSWRYCRLEPMDLVTLTDANLGLNRELVRIIEIVEDEQGTLTFKAEEMLIGNASPAMVTPPANSSFVVDANTAPGNARPPIIFEPPIALTGSPEIWMASSGGVNWGGAEVWISLDNATYRRIGSITGKARHGVLSAVLASGADPDVTHTVKVDLSTSGGTLNGGTLQDRDLLNTLCYVDGEYISFQNATLTGPYNYDITSLRRGAVGSPINSHAVGSSFVRLDESVFRYPYEASLVGKTIYVKLVSYNLYGAGLQDISSITPTAYAVAGAPLGVVSGLALAQPFTDMSCKIKWNKYGQAGTFTYLVEVYHSATLVRSRTIVETEFEYTVDDARADGGPWRDLEFRVYVLTNTGASAASVITAHNAQIGAPTAVSILPLLEGLTASCAKPADSDYGGCRVWVSSTTGFDPATTNPVYDGIDTAFFYYGLTAGATYYVRIGCYDKFGTDDMTLSSEAAVTVRGITADPAATLAGINTLLTDGSGTNKIELLSDRFSIVAPDGSKTPFAVVDVGGGVYKTLLNSDVLIGGDVDIANLKTGSLPNDVIMRLGGGTVELDGAGEVRVYTALGANQDFVSLTAAQILFKQYIAGTGYVTYNYLSRLEAGVANNNDTITIPGYWKQQPKVMVSPASLGLFKASYANQDQSIQCQALSLQETSAGSGVWQFNAVATLNLAANSGTSVINQSSGDLSADTWTSSTYTTPANCSQITPSVSLASQRGNGSGQNYYRSIRWRIEYWSGAAWVPSSWRTVNMGAQFTAITDSVAFSFPSAAAWQWRIYCEQFDTDGTVFGSQSYTYSQETVTAANISQSQTTEGSTTFGSTFNAPSGSGEIYEIDFSWQYRVQIHYTSFLNGKGLGTGGGATWSNFNSGGVVYPTYSGISRSSGTQSADYDYTSPVDTRVITGSNLTFDTTSLFGRADMTRYFDGTYYYACQTTVTLMNQSAVIKRRTLVPNSTTPTNNSALNSYVYSLTAAQVLATGSLNWLAVGR